MKNKKHLQEPCYLSGFGNHFETEALPGTLPIGRNAPQKVAHGLYAEQISGTSFLTARAGNLRTWFYRIQPSVVSGEFVLLPENLWVSPLSDTATFDPNPQRWDPLPYFAEARDFVDGTITYCSNGDPRTQTGSAIHLYAATRSMTDRFLINADAHLLMVPQEGALQVNTECGILAIAPGEIGVIPRGIAFQVLLKGERARGYLCENFGAAFRLPDLGPIGANGLANPRDFLAPVAASQDQKGDFQVIKRFQGQLWSASLDHSPLNVVAWHGNYYPYKYDLSRFNTINTVSFDHPDPSIFTVLTAPSDTQGMSNIDFVIFPSMWLVAEDTFRPAYYHRNIMSEFMGLIHGEYLAKAEGFLPGGASLHNQMTPHGPAAAVYKQAVQEKLTPQKLESTLAFMFEGRYPYTLSRFAAETPLRQGNYRDCWRGL